MTKHTYPPIVDDITEAIINRLGNNVLSVLLYGSSQARDEFFDLDLLVILKKKEDVIGDLTFLQSVVGGHPEYTLDLQIMYADEVSSADMFSLDAHGAFFSDILRDAAVLYGENPFAHLTPSHTAHTISLIDRIQRYVFQARQEYIGLGRYVKDRNPNYHRKHIARAIYDCMLMLGPCESPKQALVSFREQFPHVIDETGWKQLQSTSDEEFDYLRFYESIYTVALETARLLLPRETFKLGRATFDGMVFEYLLPERFETAIVVLDGLPRLPELSEFLNLLRSWGYAAFFPRLKGTWESAGAFLDHDPTDDIRQFTDALQKGIPIGNQQAQANRIIVLGASFGGQIALSASTTESVSHSIALSPVYRMSAVEGIETLDDFIKSAFPGAYRYAESDWQALLRDEVISQRINADKCTIVAGETDMQIELTGLRTFADTNHIPLRTIPAGHLALHKDARLIRPLLHHLLAKLD